MAKPLLYTSNQSSQTVSAANNLNLGTVTRQYGCAINSNGDTITFNSPGYYDVTINASYTGTAGNVTLALLQNGTTVNGAKATDTITTASTESHSASISSIIRVRCCLGATLTVGVATSSTSTPTFSNVSVKVVKI